MAGGDVTSDAPATRSTAKTKAKRAPRKTRARKVKKEEEPTEEVEETSTRVKAEDDEGDDDNSNSNSVVHHTRRRPIKIETKDEDDDVKQHIKDEYSPAQAYDQQQQEEQQQHQQHQQQPNTIEAIKVETGTEARDHFDEQIDQPDGFLSAVRLALPGALSPYVNTQHAMRGVVVSAMASSALAMGSRLLMDWTAAQPATSWAAWASYVNTLALPGLWTPVAGLALQIAKLTLGWGSLWHLVALDVLSYGPLVYLLAAFYKVPVAAAASAMAMQVAADVVPVWLWHVPGVVLQRRLAETNEPNDDENEHEHENEETSVSISDTPEKSSDPASFTYAAVFASVLYGFLFVQACRFFLPTTFVVHYLGIVTVEPARPIPLASSAAPTTLYEVFVCVFLSYSSLLLNTACGIATRTFLFGSATEHARKTSSYATTVSVRTAALSTVVGLSVFVQCFLGLEGVDAVGAALYASIWAAGPVLVGAALGIVGV